MNTLEPQKTAVQQSGRNHIRSFVYRRAHITPSQEQALERLAPLWTIKYQNQLIDTTKIFTRTAPIILEIGFGMGETTKQIAINRPEDNFLGIEVYNAGVGALLKRIDESQLTNIKIIQHDAVEILQNMLPENSLAGVHIYFPDPWPKKRHHKRRLIQTDFIKLLLSRMAENAYIHCATDWENYAIQMLEVLSANPDIQNCYDGFAPRPDYRPLTKFENRGLKLGHGVWDLIFKKSTVSEK